VAGAVTRIPIFSFPIYPTATFYTNIHGMANDMWQHSCCNRLLQKATPAGNIHYTF
jgi:hypothetical protein